MNARLTPEEMQAIEAYKGPITVCPAPTYVPRGVFAFAEALPVAETPAESANTSPVRRKWHPSRRRRPGLGRKACPKRDAILRAQAAAGRTVREAAIAAQMSENGVRQAARRLKLTFASGRGK